MADEFIRPSGDTTLDGWTDEADGTTTIYTKIDESSAGDSDFVQSPVISAVQADLVVRLLQGSTEIAEWTHSDISETFADGEQTLTGPELAAISDFNDLYIELDDNAGSVYKFALGNPTGALTTPVVVRYRYKKYVVPAYTGPGDIVSGATAWWGLRAYSAAVIGTNCIELRRDSDNTAQSFVTLDDGSLDVASIATFKGAANLFVRTLYDQSGNGRNAVQTTNGSQMIFTLAALGALPVIEDQGRVAITTATVTVAQPMTISFVGLYDGVAGRWAVFGESGNNIYFGHRGTNAHVYAGSEINNAVSNNWHSAQGVVNGASSDMYVDGVAGTGNAGSNSISSATLYVGQDPLGAFWNSKFTELGLWPVAFSGGEKSAMDANQAAYWGI